VIYLDTSAIIKLARVEDESAALAQWLNDHGDEAAVTSQLSEVEVPRALRRVRPDLLAEGVEVLAGLTRIAISDAVRADAGAYPHTNLRSLDAIHLATAEHLIKSGKALTAMVAYDKRLADIATELGITVATPGQALA
jgi:uncharacterized protein